MRKNRTRKNLTIAFLVAVMIGMFSAAVSRADLYKYTDRNGSMVVTDRYDSIPSRYRSKLTVIKDSRPLQQTVPAASGPAASPGREAETPESRSEVSADTWQKKWQPLAGALLVLVALYFVIGKVTDSIGGRKIGTLFFLVIALMVAIFLYREYMETMTATFQNLKKDALNIKKNVETRDDKTNRALKAMPGGE